MIGLFFWLGSIAFGILIFLLINKILFYYFSNISSNKKSLLAIILSAITADFLIHIFIAIENGYSEMMMWSSISFPLVALLFIFVNLIVKVVYVWVQDRQ
jgi:hypothetical protein